MTTIDCLKTAAAEAAVALVESGQVVGLGTGSTASLAVAILGRRVTEGLRIIGIATSEKTERDARRAGIRVSTLEKHTHIDVTIDGADEVDLRTRNLLKGRGGALLREKLVAGASDQLIIVVDDTKLVDRLGQHCAVAVEVVPFGVHATARRLHGLGAHPTLRTTAQGRAFVTQDGHYILDCAFDVLDDPDDLGVQLDGTLGVVEHGLFLGMGALVIVGTSRGVNVLGDYGL